VANPYRQLLSVPGARVFVAAGFVGRMSMSMIGIGIVLMVSAVTGSYGIAGGVSATCALAYAAGSPVVGRLADRYGQDRVLPPLVLANAVSMTTLVLCATPHTPAWAFFLAAAAAGATSPSLGAMVRARWSHLLTGTGGVLNTAFAFESVADELIFVTGPVIVTLLATQVHPAGGVAAAGLFTLVGALTLATQRRTQPPPRPREDGQTGSAITNRALMVLCGVYLLMGSVFGAIDVSAIAFAQEQGHRGLAGALLGCYALGSATGGLWYGARNWRTRLDRRFRRSLALLVIGLVPITLIHNLWIMMAVIFFCGLAISPTLIAGFGLVERLVPARQLTEGLTWVSTFIGIGVAVGASVAGRLVDAYGSAGAFLFPVCAGIAAVVVGLLGASQFGEHEFSS
jgi:MFS family permease